MVRYPPFLCLCFLVGMNGLNGQSYEVYTDETLTINSDFLQEPITLNLHKPETLELASDKCSYPLTIILDSQHTMTYPRIIGTFDFLTIDALIPETLIVGIPFNIRNRRYFTSEDRKPNDNLMGLERLEDFIFKELIPKLKMSYPINDFLVIMGHSRSAFAVNYLLTKHSDDINIAASFSGFYKEHPLSESAFENYLKTDSNFKSRIQFFLTAGTSEEESNYKNQYDELNTYLKASGTAKNLEFNYNLNPNATHMVNYWMSVPQVLLKGYEDYSAIISNWLYTKLEDSTITNATNEFKKDLIAVEDQLGLKAIPSLTHIISFSNEYYNTKSYTHAIDILNLGISYFPGYLDFYPFIIELYETVKDEESEKKYTEIYKSKINTSPKLTPKEKATLLKSLKN